MTTKPFKEGSAHGRFQPFHNGHLEYVLAAQKQSDFLWIGITKFDIDQHKEISGGEIRNEMIAGSNRWREMVPKATAKYVEEFGLIERLRTLRAQKD